MLNLFYTKEFSTNRAIYQALQTEIKTEGHLISHGRPGKK